MINVLLKILGNVDPQIWAAVITTIGVIFIGWVINKNISKLNHRHEEQLARQSPIYQIKIEENRKFISAHYALIKHYLNDFFYIPFKYISLLSHKGGLSKFTDDEMQMITNSIKREENQDVINSFLYNSKRHTLMSAIYLSFRPLRIGYYMVLREKHLLNILQNSLFIDNDLKIISDEIINMINEIISSANFDELLEKIDNESIPFIDNYNEFIEFWNIQEVVLMGLAQGMQKHFVEEWNKFPSVK